MIAPYDLDSLVSSRQLLVDFQVLHAFAGITPLACRGEITVAAGTEFRNADEIFWTSKLGHAIIYYLIVVWFSLYISSLEL